MRIREFAEALRSSPDLLRAFLCSTSEDEWQQIFRQSERFAEPPDSRASDAESPLQSASHRHLLADISPRRKRPRWMQGEKLQWERQPPADVIEFTRRHPIEVVPTLGSYLGAPVLSVLFVGPASIRIVLAEELVEERPEEAVFLIYHMLAHRALGHVPRQHGYWFRLEFEAGQTPPQLLREPGWVDEEGTADDAATCTWDDFFVDSVTMTPFSRSLARGAVSSKMMSCENIRDVMDDRAGVRNRVLKRLGGLARGAVPRVVPSRPRRPIFPERVSLVRGSDRHVFLLSEEKDAGRIWKRWIPSKRILDRLGLSLHDVKRLSDDELQGFRMGRVLIDVDEVREFRDFLGATPTQTSKLDPSNGDLANLENGKQLVRVGGGR